MKGISLSAVLQVINLERQSCDIEAKSDGKIGQLHFRDGDLVDAVADDLGGEDAAYAILAWDSPEFEVSAESAPRDRSISTGLTSLLLETARRQDEEGLESLSLAEPEPSVEEAMATELLSPAPAAEPVQAATPLASRAQGTLNAARLKRVIDIARDGLGEGLLSADVYSSADGTSFVGVNSMPAACALFNQVTARVDQSLKTSGLPALGRYYMAELEGGQMMLVAPRGDCQLSLVVDSTRVQLGLLLNVILPEVLSALNEADAQ
jgi:hypothetical protein